MNPEKETALASIKYWFKNLLSLLNKIWDKTKQISEIKITETIFAIKSLKLLLRILYELKNSIGMKSIKIEINKLIRDQNRPWPLQSIRFFSEIPEASVNK